MAKTGRKNVYEKLIKPRFSEISEWLKTGATDKQIASNLGVAESTWYKYKASEREFSEFLKNGRQSLIIQLRGALVKRAMGYEYTESKTVERVEPDGSVTMVTETYRKQALPDVAASNLCLKNYDRENWANDPQTLALRKEELELKKKQIEEGSW